MGGPLLYSLQFACLLNQSFMYKHPVLLAAARSPSHHRPAGKAISIPMPIIPLAIIGIGIPIEIPPPIIMGDEEWKHAPKLLLSKQFRLFGGLMCETYLALTIPLQLRYAEMASSPGRQREQSH